MNNGTCVDGINTYTCLCPPGYTGSNCQFRINECDSNPCLNGATCSDRLGSYLCHCPYGFTGTRCESFVDWCSMGGISHTGSQLLPGQPGQGPCFNGATCKQVNQTYQCTCAPGWTGILCDVEMVSCKDAALRKGSAVSELCRHGGKCEDIGNSHRCVCAEGKIHHLLFFNTHQLTLDFRSQVTRVVTVNTKSTSVIPLPVKMEPPAKI